MKGGRPSRVQAPGWLAACLCLAAMRAHAGGGPAPAPSAGCVDVSINQHSVLAFDCLSRALATPASAPRPPPATMDSVSTAPSNRQVGQYNAAALSHRMGSNLDKSVLPQRPPPAAPAPPAVLLKPGH